MTKMIAQAAAAPASSQGSFTTMLVVWLLFIGGFYFLFIAPQKKKQKELEKMLRELQSGDDVMTTGGIFGTVTNVKEDRFVIRVSENTKIEVAKGNVQAVIRKQNEEKKAS